MQSKAALVVGLAAGYVFGTRDGRERYEQIKSQALRFWQDPRVQQKAAQARDLAKEKATQAQDLAKEKAPEVQEKVAAAARKTSSSTTPTTPSEPKLTADTPDVAVDPHV